MEAQRHRQQSDDRVHASAKQAWNRLQELKLAATPENYVLFFAYYNGHEKALINGIDAVLANPQNNSELKLENALLDVYDRFVNTATQQAFLNTATSQFDDEMKQIMGVIEAARKGADDYSTALDTFNEKLEPEISVEQIRYMVTQMALETRTVAEQNEKTA